MQILQMIPDLERKRNMKILPVTLVLLLATLKICNSRHTVRPSSNEDLQTPEENVCLTLGCFKAASDVLSHIDESVDPCNNFYRFACGGWLKQHAVIPEDKSAVSSFTEIGDELDLNLKELLEKESDGSEPRFIKLTKDMYNSCMDTETIENSGSEPLKETLETLGGWPVVEGSEWDESDFDWVDSVISFRKLGLNHATLMAVYVGSDLKSSSHNIIQVNQASLGMPDRAYLIQGLRDSATVAYFKLMVKSAKHLGADEETVESELMNALNFEIALANISLPDEELRDLDKLYNKYTVKNLQEMIPQIPWLKLLNGLLKDKIYEDETLIVGVPEFVKDFAKLITETDKRVVANYMVWRAVLESMSSLSEDWRKLQHDYSSVITGRTREQPRWKECLSAVTGSELSTAIGHPYVQHYFNEESKEVALELVNYIRKEFINILENIDWMEEETRNHAIAKARGIKPYIGYPDELLNITALQEIYENLTLTTESYYKNIQRSNKWSMDFMFSKLRKRNIKGDWKMHAEVAVVNAFYMMEENSIDFPAGILQQVFFDKNRPNYMNYGGIGFVIGHEITHGFDDTGKQFDKDGNNVNWWDKETDKQYEERAQCIVEQYGNYTAENGMKLNGINTLGENIADNGGLKEAYRAYHSWVEDNGPEPLLPGVDYNQNQLFWISVANGFCDKTRPEAMKLNILSDSHSPDEFRIVGSMSNLEQFSRDFNCPPNSPMNKRPKCRVW